MQHKNYRSGISNPFLSIMAVMLCIAFNACGPKEPIVLREVKDVVADASSEPRLKAEAVFYNPNKIRMKLRKIKVDVFVNGKKTAEIDQDLHTLIPASDTFSVMLEAKLAMKELNLMDTIFGMLGGNKLDVSYKGFLKLSYHGIPVKVPVNYSSQIRIRI